MQFVIERISQIGTIPLCNGMASRAPHLFGYCFILCYRCTFILLLFGCTLWFLRKKIVSSIQCVWLLLIPMVLDGGLQTFFVIESTNVRRSITGAMFGIGIGYIMKYICHKIDEM